MTSPVNKNTGAQGASAAEMNAHTEQALVELVYVRTGNEILGNALLNLQGALQVTQSVLNLLQQLQNLHNQINVTTPSAFNFPYHSGPTSVLSNPNATSLSASATRYEAAYLQRASAYFGQQLTPYFAVNNVASFASQLQTIKNKLAAEIQLLFNQTPPAARGDPNSLLGQLKTVYNELPTDFSKSGLAKWVTDNYSAKGSTASLAGKIQADLTAAITAAESLNDTQKEKVRRYLFIFQEYYQSAAAILNKITQICEMMAQKISQ